MRVPTTDADSQQHMLQVLAFGPKAEEPSWQKAHTGSASFCRLLLHSRGLLSADAVTPVTKHQWRILATYTLPTTNMCTMHVICYTLSVIMLYLEGLTCA